MDDLDLVCGIVRVLQDAALGRVRHRHHLVASLQRPIQPNLLHQPSLPTAMLLQEPVVVDREHRLPALQKQRREVDVARDVNDVCVESPCFKRNA